MTNENDTLQQALRLGEHMQLLSSRIDEAEQVLNALKEERKTIEERALPDMFEEIGLESLTLANGTTVSLKKFPVGRLTQTTRQQALQWLRENYHDGIINNTFKVGLKTHEREQADQMEHFLRENNIPFENKEDVHPSTLKAFIKEQAENEGFPKDLFNVYEVRKVEFSG